MHIVMNEQKHAISLSNFLESKFPQNFPRFFIKQVTLDSIEDCIYRLFIQHSFTQSARDEFKLWQHCTP